MKNAKFKMQNVKTRPEWEFVILHFSLCIALATSAGCSYFFYPKASEVLEKAKGASGVETILNLTTMLEASAKAARGGQGYDVGLNDLHNQFHALDKAFCQVTKEQASTPAYAKAVTINKEMGAIFKRLWKYRNDQAGRDVHLDLFAKRVQELREAIQAVKG
ncbi:MAG: hypothetical protein AABZ22_01890 [Nitrospirota bacterium]